MQCINGRGDPPTRKSMNLDHLTQAALVNVEQLAREIDNSKKVIEAEQEKINKNKQSIIYWKGRSDALQSVIKQIEDEANKDGQQDAEGSEAPADKISSTGPSEPTPSAAPTPAVEARKVGGQRKSSRSRK